MTPQDHHQQLNEQIARILAFGCFGVLLLRLIISPLPPLLLGIAVSCVIWMMVLYFAIRRELLLEHAAHATMYSIVGWLIVVTLSSGGAHSPILYIYPLVPMLSGLILPGVHTLIITGLVALLALVLIELEHWGMALPLPQLQPQEFDHSRTLWLVTCLVIAACVALYFARQNKLLATTLREEARIDFLTRIPNRRGLEEELQRQAQHAGKHDSSLAILMIDIDHFKRFNDHFGHTEGDRCLGAMASLLRVWASTQQGYVGRYGGEEFMIILPDADTETATAAAETIRRQIEQQSPHCVPPNAQIRNLTVTIGVSSLPGADLQAGFDSLIEAADQALYLGKAQGRNQVVVQAALPSQLRADTNPSVVSPIRRGKLSS